LLTTIGSAGFDTAAERLGCRCKYLKCRKRRRIDTKAQWS